MDGPDANGVSVSVSLRGNVTRSPSWRHAFVLVGDIAGVFNPIVSGQRVGAGGSALLRGYEPNELLGRGRVLAVAEYRLTAFADLHVNLAHAFFLREIQIALFTGAAAIAMTDDGRDLAFVADVGVGVRLHFEYGGVQPSVLRLDLALPLVAVESYQREYATSFVLAFEQYF